MTDIIKSKQQIIDELEMRAKELTKKGDIAGVAQYIAQIDAVRSKTKYTHDGAIISINFSSN